MHFTLSYEMRFMGNIDGAKYDSCDIDHPLLLVELTLCSSSESSVNS